MRLFLALMLATSAAFAAKYEPWQKRYLLASRNSGGTYSLPNPAVVTGGTISSTWANSTLNDLATEITNSLDRAGRGAMTGPLRLFHGASAAAPDLAWDNETNTGFYKFASGDIRLSLLGADAFKYNATGFYVLGTVPGLFAHDVVVGWAGIWAGGAVAAPTVSNYSLLMNGTTTLVNAPTGGTVELRVNNGTPAAVVATGATVTTNQPLTIGTTGTAISASLRGVLAVGGGTINANTCANQSVSVSGAAIGADCSAGYATVVNANFITSCSVTASNVCTVTTCNLMGTNQAAPANTLACRVWNP